MTGTPDCAEDCSSVKKSRSGEMKKHRRPQGPAMLLKTESVREGAHGIPGIENDGLLLGQCGELAQILPLHGGL